MRASSNESTAATASRHLAWSCRRHSCPSTGLRVNGRTAWSGNLVRCSRKPNLASAKCWNEGSDRIRKRHLHHVQLRILSAYLHGLFGVETIEVLEDAHEAGNGQRSRPVALEFAIHLYAADELRARLFHSAQRRLVRGQ